jgi:glycosyltransferase involved in cell wall biosynthesis
MEPSFGIVIPTRPRCRFLPRALAQVRSQTHPHWHCVLVSDGPSDQARALYERHKAGDARFSYQELAAPTRDWGFTPRLRGLDVLASLPQPPDYVAFWDDDNSFYPVALTRIAQALRAGGPIDLLLAPIHSQLSHLPKPGLTASELKYGDVDTANFVVRFELARRLYPADEQIGVRGQDQRFFARVQAERCHCIALANIPPMGRYDGLRRLATWRWRLGIPPLGLDGRGWYAPLRRWLRG